MRGQIGGQKVCNGGCAGNRRPENAPREGGTRIQVILGQASSVLWEKRCGPSLVLGSSLRTEAGDMTCNTSAHFAGENAQHQSPKLGKNPTPEPGWTVQAQWSGRRSKYGSPLKAIRRHCVECSGDNAQEVKHCPGSTCLLWPYRFGQMPQTAIAKSKPADPDLAPVKPLRDGPAWPVKRDGRYVSPLRAIRGYCLGGAGTWHDVEYCEITDCPLCAWRFGVRPETAAKRGKTVDPP